MLALLTAPIVFYLNHDGGTYRPGDDDAKANTSSVLRSTAHISPWDVDDAEWGEVVSCISNAMSRWNVTVTDQDPGKDVSHYELVIAGRPSDLGYEGTFTGVAPLRSDCSVIPDAVVFTFAELIQDNPQAVCGVALQEIGHAFGLDHAYLECDPMSYLPCDGQLEFQDVDAECGEYAPRQCYCGGETQNTVEHFDSMMGLAGGAAPDPEVDGELPEPESAGCSAGGSDAAPGAALALFALFGVTRRGLRRSPARHRPRR